MRHTWQLTTLATIAPILASILPGIAAIEMPPAPDAAKVLPSDTAYVVLLDTREETWQQLEQYALFQVLETLGGEPPNPTGLPFLPAGLDYQTEIAPWIGDTAALALLPLGRPVITLSAEREVVVAPIARPEEFTGFIETVTNLQGTDPQTQRHQDVSILYWEPQFLEEEVEDNPGIIPLPEGAVSLEPLLKALPERDPDTIKVPQEPIPDVPGLAIAVLPDFLVAADNPAAIRSWLNLRPGDEAKSLAFQDRFQRTVAHPEYDSALGALYLNLSEAVKYSLSDLSLLNLPLDLPRPETFFSPELAELAALQLNSSIEVLLYPQPEGIRIQGRAYYDDTLLRQVFPSTEPAPNQVLETVPAASYLMLSGQNIASTWQQIAIAMEASEETAELLNGARAFFQIATGLDLDQEFFGWMDQGFTFFLFPTRQTPLTLLSPDLQLGFGVALQTSDREAAEYALSQLNQQLGASFATLEPHTLNEQAVSSWSIDFDGNGKPDSFLGHGWANENTLIVTTSIGSLAEVLNLSTRQTLSSSPIFRRAIQGFPLANQGYFYSNLSATQSLIYSIFPWMLDDMTEFAEFRQALSTLQAVSSTVSFTEDYFQLDGLLILSPAQ